MRTKLLHLTLVLTSLVGYLEWGAGRSTFLFQAEVQLITQGIRNPSSVLHPFAVLPMLGQMALVWTLFQASSPSWLAYVGIACIGLLFALLVFIGVLGLNARILAGALPFALISVVTIRHHRHHARPPRVTPGANS